MVKKEKIYELKIEEDDDVSGVDSISLVDDPAIEINWVAFKKEKEHEFHIPDGQDNAYLERLLSIAKSEKEILEDDFEIISTEYLNKDYFAKTFPNAQSELDGPNIRIRYKYTLNPEATGNKIIATTRDFCRELLNEDLVWRIEDMLKQKNSFGQSAFVWRGGYNCRHIWAKITYKKKGYIPNDAAYTDIVDYSILGIEQPDTRTKHPSFSKEDFSKISLDYDGTLSTNRGQQLAQRLKGQGNDLYIVTARHKSDANAVLTVAKQLGIPENHVHFTEGQPKWKTLQRLGISKHYDNNPNVIEDIRKHMSNINAEQFDYNVGSIGGYVDPAIEKKKKKEFDTHSDYPESVKNNAKRALAWVEKNGWGSCGTDVGKQRAHQLASGEALTMDTIKRMYSYLSRHSVDLESSTSFDKGCGALMYACWGGKSALSWAESKIKQAEKKNFGLENFAADEEKHIVLGPAMVPNLKIFRKDKQGNPYYVFFTPETIKMIAEKYMKHKYTDNNDEMHDGKAVKDVYVIESWIKEDAQDKSTKYGFEHLPVGTWFVSMKINNPEVWKKVKDGELNGFSVSGYFEEVAEFTREMEFLNQLAALLKTID